ncbi:MAG: hypothetical protein KF729_27855 [Sandaracinaceae bacterium]|nr:hypothetical protein [Sandaracinaceae bacterium]
MSEIDPLDALADAGARRLEALDPATRRARGVVHTPAAIARYVARAIADAPGTLVDPACGPGVFVAACIEAHGSARRAIGMDVDPAAIAEAAAVVGPRAEARGWSLELRTGNTLAAPLVERGPLVIVGNPPWAGRTANAGAAYTDALLADFRRDAAGAPLGERKIGVLSDDYVRFLRWACEQLRRPQGGALAMVTSASFLDGPVHRGMRARLLRWFATIDLVDLGGSALVAKEGGVRDENVFGVRPGVVITVARRPAGHPEDRDGEVRVAALRGARADKLDALDRGALDFVPLAPAAPLARFVPARDVGPAYARWPPLPALLPFHREGVQTNRDELCVDADRARLDARLDAFARGEAWPGKAGVPSAHYDPRAAAAALTRARAAGETVVRRLAYRPGDDRFACLVRGPCHRPRLDLLAAMDRSVRALLTVRKDRGERAWAHFGATPHPVDNCWLSSRSSCRTRAFPTHRPDGVPNLDAAAVRAWAGFVPEPVALSDYVLGVLAAASYRARYDDALRADYPRIPPPPDRAAFDALSAAGSAVAAALSAPPQGGAHVVIGHRVLASDALEAAVRACDVAYRTVDRH